MKGLMSRHRTLSDSNVHLVNNLESMTDEVYFSALIKMNGSTLRELIRAMKNLTPILLGASQRICYTEMQIL